MGLFDGVFKKEACAVCGKEVGMLSRSKLQDKQYICDDCRKNINPFIRSDYITLEEFHQAVRQAEQDQKLLENAPSDSSYLQHGSESIAVKHYYTKGVFTIQSNRHRNAKYPPVFYYNEVRPYDPSANFVEKQMGSDPRRLGNMNLILLHWRKNMLRTERMMAGRFSSPITIRGSAMYRSRSVRILTRMR